MSFLPECRAMVFENARFGSSPGDATPASNPYARTMTGYLMASICMVAAGLGGELERCTQSQDLLVADEPIDILSGTLSMLAWGTLDPASRLPAKAQVVAASVATAMHEVNALPVVYAAESGIRTFLDLRRITGRGVQFSPGYSNNSTKGYEQ